MISTKFRPTASKCTISLYHKRNNSDFKTNFEILTKYFHLPPAKAAVFLETKNLLTRQPINVMKSIEYCKKIGFCDQDLLANSSLLTTHSLTLEHRYLAMKEGGFDVIAPAALAKFLVLHKKPVEKLKMMKYIKETTDVARSFISYLKPCPNGFWVDNLDDLKPWTHIHSQILREYLKWRLQVKDDDVTQLLVIHRGVKYKSFGILCENLSIAEELGFSPQKILKCGYLLHNYPKHTKTALENYSNLAGADMKVAMRSYPKLVTTSPVNIEKIYNILKDHQLPDETIRKKINVLHMSPNTVEFRLKELERIRDLKVLMKNPGVLKLVVHHNRAKSRLNFLKKLNFNCFGVGVLGNETERFEKHVRTGHDSNNNMEINAFLKGLFNRDPKEFFDRLRRHPRYLEVPLVDIADTYEYLREQKFTSRGIFKVIWILLYSKEYIRDALTEVEEFKKSFKGETLRQVTVLNLLLYFLEKDHYFRGCGVKKRNDGSHEFDEVVDIVKVRNKL